MRLLALLLALSSPGAPPPPPPPAPASPAPLYEQVQWHQSRSLGLPYAGGRLLKGVRLPAEGERFFTWDPVLERTPNRDWRRYGATHTVRRTLEVLERFAFRNPGAPRVGIGDLSRTHGGDFGPRYGSIGHASHQNGLDVDVYYPRLDRLERAPRSAAHVDRELAQELVDLFVDAGAKKVFTGPSLGLRGPRRIAVPLRHHDNHLHARFAR